jgi:hypothetical protein
MITERVPPWLRLCWGECVCLWIGEYVWKPVGHVPQVIMQVSGNITKDTRTELRGETLQNEADYVTMWGDLV